MFDWVKSKCPGRNGKYHVSQRIVTECEKREKGTNKHETRDGLISLDTREAQKHKIQVKVIKNKEVSIISPSVEIVEVMSNVKQSPIENFLTSDEEPTSSETSSFKDFIDCSSGMCPQTYMLDSHSLIVQNSQISDCVLVDLIQFKGHNSKTFSYETDSDSGISSLSCQSSSLSCQSEIQTSSEQSFRGQANSESRTSVYLSNSEYSFDSLCFNTGAIYGNVEKPCFSNIPNESVHLSDSAYSFDSDSCLHCEPQSIDLLSRIDHLSRNSVCLSDSCYSFNSDSKSLHSVKLGKSLTQSISKSSVCLSDCNYSFDTDPESVEVSLDDKLPSFNPKTGFGLNRWYKQ